MKLLLAFIPFLLSTTMAEPVDKGDRDLQTNLERQWLFEFRDDPNEAGVLQPLTYLEENNVFVVHTQHGDGNLNKRLRIKFFETCPNGDEWYTDAEPDWANADNWLYVSGLMPGLLIDYSAPKALDIDLVATDPTNLYYNDFYFKIDPDIVNNANFVELDGQAEVSFCLQMALLDWNPPLTSDPLSGNWGKIINFVQLSITVIFDLVDEHLVVASFTTEVVDPTTATVEDAYGCVARLCPGSYETDDGTVDGALVPFKNGEEVCIEVCPEDSYMTDVAAIDQLILHRDDPDGPANWLEQQNVIFDSTPLGGFTDAIDCAGECCRIKLIPQGGFFPVPTDNVPGSPPVATINGDGICILTLIQERGRRQLRARTRALAATTTDKFQTEFEVEGDVADTDSSVSISTTASLVLGAAGALMI